MCSDRDVGVDPPSNRSEVAFPSVSLGLEPPGRYREHHQVANYGNSDCKLDLANDRIDVDTLMQCAGNDREAGSRSEKEQGPLAESLTGVDPGRSDRARSDQRHL